MSLNNPSRPMLRRGSQGDDVLALQTVLNGWLDQGIPPLVPDAQFGPNTDRIVRYFQSAMYLMVDGIVGPNTWGKLPETPAVIGGIPPFELKETDEEWQARVGALICQKANDAYLKYSMQSPAPNASSYGKISAARGFGPSVPGVYGQATGRIPDPIGVDVGPGGRKRQGGLSLREIFTIGGAFPNQIARCENISYAAEQYWWPYSKTAEKNAQDLPAWCGIFAFHVYKLAGLDIGWMKYSTSKSQADGTRAGLRSFNNPADAVSGCIGVEDANPNGRNHHFIVIHNDKAGRNLYTIDGNLHAARSKQGPLLSTVGERVYPYSHFRSESGFKQGSGFMFPDRDAFPTV